MFGLSIGYSWKANAFIEFYHFMKKDDEILFSIPLFSKIDHPPGKKERLLSIYEIMKLLQYNYHHMNSITKDIFHIDGLKNLKHSNHHS